MSNYTIPSPPVTSDYVAQNKQDQILQTFNSSVMMEELTRVSVLNLFL